MLRGPSASCELAPCPELSALELITPFSMLVVEALQSLCSLFFTSRSRDVAETCQQSRARAKRSGVSSLHHVSDYASQSGWGYRRLLVSSCSIPRLSHMRPALCCGVPNAHWPDDSLDERSHWASNHLTLQIAGLFSRGQSRHMAFSRRSTSNTPPCVLRMCYQAKNA